MPSHSLDSLSDEQIVKEAKALYAQAEKVESQADSLKADASEKKWEVAERCRVLSERSWSQTKIAKAITVSQQTVSRWLRMVEAYPVPSKRPAFGEAYVEIEPDAGTLATYRRHTKALVKTDPESAADIVAEHAPEVVAKKPRVRAAARKHEEQEEAKRKPSPVGPRADHLLFQYEGKLTSAETTLREALAILAEIDQPGDDEDILDQLDRLAQLVEINKESYRTGKSLDTWVRELEGSAE